MTSSHRSTALRLLIAAGAVVLTGAATTAPASSTAATAQAAATAPDWRTIAPENLLVIDTNKGRILVELEPRAAPAHVERIRTLTNRGFYDGLKFHRVMRNFMAQTGDPLGTGEGGSDLPDLAAEFSFRRGRNPDFSLVPGSGAGTRGFLGSLPVQTQPDAQMFVTADMKVDANGLFCPGVLGMARAGDPNSANSQFFLMTGTNVGLNGTYTAFGHVVVGQDVVKSLKVGSETSNGAVEDPDVMTRVRIASALPEGERPTVRGKRVLITKADGFQSLKALLPPPSRRALVLIDPPYEDKMDYRKVKDTLADALVRFPSGMYAVWYPVLQRMESRQFADKLKQLPSSDWLHVTLTVNTPSPDGFGLHSSGMFILNPPYTLEPMLREVMPYLVKVLGRDDGAKFVLETGKGGQKNTGTRRV